MDQSEPSYPLQFSVDFPVEPRNRLTVFFRLITVLPIGAILIFLEGGSIPVDQESRTAEFLSGLGAGAGFLFAAPLLMILFRKKYPRWWFDWNLALLRL